MPLKSVERAVKILELFSLKKPNWSVSEISKSMDLNKATVHGFLSTLKILGYLKQDPETKRYLLGFKIYELGIILACSLEINQKGAMPAHLLSKRTNEMVRVATLDKSSIVITLDSYPKSKPFILQYFSPRAPLYCSAMGKAILAHLGNEYIDNYIENIELVAYTPNTIIDKNKLKKELLNIEINGYSLNKVEHIPGRAAIAAPIFDRNGKVVASICIAGHPSNITKNQNKLKFINEVKNTAWEISRKMGYFKEFNENIN